MAKRKMAARSCVVLYRDSHDVLIQPFKEGMLISTVGQTWFSHTSAAHTGCRPAPASYVVGAVRKSRTVGARSLRPQVHSASTIFSHQGRVRGGTKAREIALYSAKEDNMVRGFILWLLGVPLIGIFILYFLGYL
ncbi:hypothetical protein ASD64_18805 [Mesorhizobium sp. Root157]|nr:hypothetical protein ASD64_18805 [Mesorhizobium sp. Root157]